MFALSIGYLTPVGDTYRVRRPQTQTLNVFALHLP